MCSSDLDAMSTANRLQVSTAGVAATRALGRRLARFLRAGDVVLLQGPLGAGKTALAQGIGAGLLQDAIRRTLRAAEIAGIRAIVVHAVDEAAARFYERQGFLRSTAQPLTSCAPAPQLSSSTTATKETT